ncbi:MAG: TolC family protein, partial [Mucilaginibacter sp.]
MKHILIILLACGFALKSNAQLAASDTQRYNFTIQDCINYAYAHQNDVKNANLDVTSADYHVKEIIGQGLPQISGSASFQDYIKTAKILFPNSHKQLYTVLNQEGVMGSNGKVIAVPDEADNVAFSFTQKYNANLGLNASLILFDPNYIVGLQGRKTYKELYSRSYTRTKIEASVNVTKAYYQVLVSVEQLKLLAANIAQLKQQLDETIARNKQGFVEKIDVDRLTVQYNSQVTRQENIIRLLEVNYQMLKFQMGMPVDKTLTLRDKLEDVKIEASAADANNDTTVYRNRIEY